MLERLEPRKLLHSSSLDDGVLRITDDDGADDRMLFTQTGDGFRIDFAADGEAADPETYSYDDVRYVEIRAGDGGDEVVLGNLRVPANVRGGSGGDTLSGGLDRDTLNGDDGDDSLFGHDASDRMNGGRGGDYIGGGAGLRDIADYSDRTVGVIVGLGTEYDDGSNEDDGDTSERQGDNVNTDVEVLWGGSGADRFTTDSGRSVVFQGGGGGDRLVGGSGDRLVGGSGDDYFDGGAGRDVVIGFGGDDFFSMQDAERDTIATGSGNDDGLYDEVPELDLISVDPGNV